MVRKRQIAAGEFKARCLAILDDVSRTGEEITVTKRGKPIARVVPVEAPEPLRGSVVRDGDLISPIDDSWDVDE